MGYDPAFPRTHYDRVADKEWTRLSRKRRGELNFLVHMDVLRQHISAEMDVLEVGAGAGIYTKELVHMARRLVVSDLSQVQLALNRDHMRDLGVLNQVDEYRVFADSGYAHRAQVYFAGTDLVIRRMRLSIASRGRARSWLARTSCAIPDPSISSRASFFVSALSVVLAARITDSRHVFRTFP